MNRIILKNNFCNFRAQRSLLWGVTFTLAGAGLTCLVLGILSHLSLRVIPLSIKHPVTMITLGSAFSISGIGLGGKIVVSRLPSKKNFERKSFLLNKETSIEEYLGFKSPDLKILQSYEIHQEDLRKDRIASFKLAAEKTFEHSEDRSLKVPVGEKIYLTVCSTGLVITTQTENRSSLYFLSLEKPCFNLKELENKIHLSFPSADNKANISVNLV